MECHIVIRESTISYERPVREDIRTVCARPAGETLKVFKRAFRQKGRARISLSATIEDGGITAVRFRGIFIAMG